MSYKKVFKMPKAVKITGRSSSITNSFVNGIIPVIEPTEEEVKKALEILGMDANTICCAYCGDPYTEWDHLRPLVVNKTATGYVSEIHNLVPSCGKCNQSKGNQTWHEWMYSSATLSPLTRQIPDLSIRSKRLSEYEKWGTPLKVDIEAIVGKYKWQQHWENCEKIKALMKESQILSDEIRETLQQAMQSSNQEVKDCFYEQPSKPATKKLSPFARYFSSKPAVPTQPTSKTEPAKSSSSAIAIDRTKPVGKIVQNEFKNLLQSGKIDDFILNKLQNKSYSKQTFDVNYPVLLSINSLEEVNKGIDHTGRNRYYTNPIKINGNLYLLTSQWYDRSKDKLTNWIVRFDK